MARTFVPYLDPRSDALRGPNPFQNARQPNPCLVLEPSLRPLSLAFLREGLMH